MTTTEFPYKLKPYKTGSDREECPNCGQKRAYARYVDSVTGEEIPAKYGRCNRQDQCGYHLNPMTDAYKTDKEGLAPTIALKPEKPNVIVDLPVDLLTKSLPWQDKNTLAVYFKKLFPDTLVRELFRLYMVGNHSVWPGAVVFWFVNSMGAIRAGQVKQFDVTGHTVKLPNNEGQIKPRTIWIHNLIKDEPLWMKGYKEQKLRQDCLFGEHLLPGNPNKRVAMFESPKTAMMAAAYFPDCVCLAFGSLDNFTYDRALALKGRKVILYPDLSQTGSVFAKWTEKAERFKSITDFKVSRILEDNATQEERDKGLDMGDFLERFDYLEFAEKKIKTTGGANAGSATRSVSFQKVMKRDEKEDSREFDKIGESVNQPIIDKKETAQRGTPDSELPGKFDLSDFSKWYRSAAIPTTMTLFEGTKNALELFDTHSFISGRLRAISAYSSAKPMDKDDLNERRTRHIAELQYIRKIYPN